jgi:hypothetical protein
MPAEVNGNHVIAHFSRARAILYNSDEYYVCGTIVITPYFVFMSGHGNENTNFEPVVSIAVPRDDIRLIIDHSVEACETHDKMDAEAKAQMESLSNAEESKKD